MKINPVHALLEVLRQQSRAQASDSSRTKPGAVQEALRQQMRGVPAAGTTIKPDSPIGQILAESRDTKFRLEMLEKLVSDKLGVRGTSLRSALVEEPNLNSEKPIPAKMVSSGATDALNQTVQQSHGRAWHGQPNLWNNLDAEFLKYHTSDAGLKSPDSTIGMAEKFTPTVEDIESALFKEGADPAEFARVFMARGDIPFERTDPNFGPRLVPIAIGVMMLMVVAYLIF